MMSQFCIIPIFLYLMLSLCSGFIPSFPKNLAVKNTANIRRFDEFRTYSEISSPTKTETFDVSKEITQKDYLIAVRNRLFAIEEKIWLHEYSIGNPNHPKIKPLKPAKIEELLRARAELLEEYPTTQLYLDITFANRNNLTYAAQYIERMVENFNRQMPTSLSHLNQIAVLSNSGEIIDLMRGQGSLSHRLMSSNLLNDRNLRRQFQHPAFSHQGKYLSIVEMQFRSSKIERSDILIFEIPKDPKTYGTKRGGSLPTFTSGKLPGTPFFQRFSPDDRSVAALCSSPPNASGESYTQLVVVDWNRLWNFDSRLSPIKEDYRERLVLTVLRGNPVFFTYTTSCPRNGTIIAHCQKEIENRTQSQMVSEKAVWSLAFQDTSGVLDYKWTKICDSDPQVRWTTPVAHSAGGGDNVIVVEDGHLVTRAISRWKRDKATGELKSKILMPVKGQVQFLASADNSKLAVLQEDINIGLYSLTVFEGEEALDPANPSLGKKYEFPSDKLAVAFWFSPDSSKILCLTAADSSKDDVSTQKGQFRVGLNSEMEWTVFNFPLQELRTYDRFKPTPYFMKTYVPFFGQYAQMYNPWAPDSRSFIYVTATGLCHTPLVKDRVVVGQDKWMNAGATFGTWSRF